MMNGPARGSSRAHRLLDVLSTFAVAVAVLTMTGFYLHDRLAQPDGLADLGEPETVENWEAENQRGLWIGPPDASVVVTEFLDYQCPFCAALVPRLDSLEAEYEGDMAIVVHHFPLSMHEEAIPAAIAAECAHQQDYFEPFHHFMFANQRTLGRVPWRELGEMADVPNLEAFTECIALPPESFPRITYGRELGARVGVRGTPSLWINGRAIGRTDLYALRTLAEMVSK